MEGQRILSGRYALVSHLARGGMADVYAGHDRLLDRRVAIKILHPEYAANEAFVERFRREAQAAANLNHHNIVDIYDWGRDQGVYFMVMELIQGRNLREVLRAEGALEPRRVAEITTAVAAALGAAHERGLVHRDVKPANVLITPEGEVKVTDFGIARAWDDSDQLTRTGAVIGTATYFSPEQAQGLTADGRSDIYALGVVMYELLTGVPPFVGESPVSVAYQHVREFAPPPSDLNPNIPEALDAIVMRCLEKDPRRRYQTAGALAVDLGRFLSGQVPSALPPSEAPTRLMAPAGAPPLPPAAAAQAKHAPAYREPGRPDRSTVVIGILAAVALFGLGLTLLLRLLLPGGSDGLVTIPDLRGQAREAAAAELERLGLQVGDDQLVADGSVTAGLVVGTDPPSGNQVEAGATVSLLISSGAGDATVPALVGETENAAQDLLRQAGLNAAITYEPSEVVPAGIVMAQDPEAGQVVPAASSVALVVSAGTDALTVPDVVNHSEHDALLKLADAGFETVQISIQREPSSEVLEGFVIETEPTAGSTLPADGVVTIVISRGAIPTVVPGVIGQTPENARATLEDRGFVVIFGDPVDLPFGDPGNGKVVAQDPAGGATVDYGASVTLQVGESSATIEVPNVLGQTPTAARAAIEAADLVYAEGATYLLDAGDPDIGKVAAVSPGVGTQVDAGDTVTVRIGVEGARIPNVACQTATDAQPAIEAAGLVYAEAGVVDDAGPGDPCVNKVVAQSPAPFTSTGILVAKGSTVAVTIDGVRVPDVRAWTLKAEWDAAHTGPPPQTAPPSEYDLAKSKQLLEALGFIVVIQECEVPEPYLSAYLGMVVDIDFLGSPPGSTARLLLSTVTIFRGIDDPSTNPNMCQHLPPP